MEPLKQLLSFIGSFFDGGLKKLLMSYSAFFVSIFTSNEAQAMASLLGFVSVIMAIRYYISKQKLINKMLATPVESEIISKEDVLEMIDDAIDSKDR